MFGKLKEFVGHSRQKVLGRRKNVQASSLDADEMLRERYGNALFASQYDLDCAGLLFTHMGALRLPYLGGHYAPEFSDGSGGHGFSHVFAPQEGHILTIAGEDGDAEARQITPNVICYRGSMVIVDPEGYHADLTQPSRTNDPDNPAGLRRVFRFDPFGGQTNRYNPMDALSHDASGTFEDARVMADMLVMSRDRQDAVEESVRSFLAGALMHVARTRKGTDCSLATVRDLTARRSRDFDDLLVGMAQSPEEEVRAAADVWRALGKGRRKAVRERLDHDLAVWDLPEIRAATAVSDEDFQMRFLHHHEGMTVYLVIPTDRFPACASVLRVLIGQAATCFNKPMFNTPVWSDARPSGPPVMLMIDWMSDLGYMAPLVDRALAYDGRHLKMWWIVRGIEDLGTVCGEGLVEAMFHRFQTVCFYRLDEEAASERAASLLHDLTKRRRKQLFLEDDYEYISAREIRNLPSSTGIALIKGLPPALLRLPPFNEIEELADRHEA